MDKSFIRNIQEKQLVALTKQVRTAIADRVLETLATKKVEIAQTMGIQESVTKKDFIATAKTMKAHKDSLHKDDKAGHAAHASMVHKFSDQYAKQNPRFDRNKFHTASGLHEAVNVGGSGNPKVGEPSDSQDGRTEKEKKYLLPETKKKKLDKKKPK